MSDRIEQVSRCYRENVSPAERPIQTGRSPSQNHQPGVQGMWSAAVGIVLATLRYIAPAVFALFWGQHSLLYRLIRHVETTVKSIIYSSDAQRDSVLQWLGASGSVRVENMETVWQHGWLLCGAIDTVVPGACAGHPPSRLSLEHAQIIAETHLGVEPVFSRQEFENTESLNRHQEWKLAHYLDRIRLALAKLSPPVSKQNSPSNSPEMQMNFDYVAKGSGLTAAQPNQKSYFRVYPSEQQSLEPGEITIIIKGPNKIYGMSNGPPILGKAQSIRQKVLGLQEKHRYTENALPLTQGTTYLRNYGKNDMNKTYYIPKEKHEIDIDVQIRQDHLKIGYVVKIEGEYEISVTSRGLHILGSPFTVTATKDIIKVLEKKNSFLEDGETINIVDEKSDRKVVLRIVDFVTEKMLLKENGTLEKISEDEANVLIYNDRQNRISKNLTIHSENNKDEVTEQLNKNRNQNRFRDASTKVSKILKVCKVLNSTLNEKNVHNNNKDYTLSCPQKDIPDIVNSTLSETLKPLSLSSKSIETNKEEVRDLLQIYKEQEFNKTQDSVYDDMNVKEMTNNNDFNKFRIADEYRICKIPCTVYNNESCTNPFLEDVILQAENNFDLNNPKETINRINTFTSDPIHIFINEEIDARPSSTNPFLDVNVGEIERPKTPILKILTGDIKDRNDSIYISPENNDDFEGMEKDEFINPFFVYKPEKMQINQESFPITDFIIGAPVSLPPILKAPSPEPNNINSMLLTAASQYETNNQKPSQMKSSEDSTFVPSKDKTAIENIDSTYETESHCDPSLIIKHQEPNSIGEFSDIEYEAEARKDSSCEIQIHETLNKNVEITNKELWDSAYVSIDDNNSTSDTNNNNFGITHNDLCETQNEEKYFFNMDTNYEDRNIFPPLKMGPAEREIWQTCEDLSAIPRTDDFKSDSKMHKNRRPIFTPIMEENERSISTGKNVTQEYDQSNDSINIDPVSVAFAELNEVFEEYCPESDPNSLTSVTDKEKFDSIVIDHAIQSLTSHVDPASVNADVERQETENLEGTISGVQQTATELDSASRTLQLHFDSLQKVMPKIKREFGENTSTNIVLEKKKYWDEKIKQIEEMKAQQPKRKKSFSKPLKHNDSLTKRKGKQIVKNFLNATENEKTAVKQTHIEIMPDAQNDLLSNDQQDLLSSEKLVDKWKKFWDAKLESENSENKQQTLEMSRAKSPLQKTIPASEICPNQILEIKTEQYIAPPIVPVKQEIAEEVFKAFETSPKRFFGTSRKQILNKIDAFLKKPSANDKQPQSDETKHESGIVSSRITLYHKIAKVEPVNVNQRESSSLYSFKKESLQHKLEEAENKALSQNNKYVKYVKDINEKKKGEQEEQIPVPKTERVVPKQLSSLRKSSVSKSEMDIFNKVSDSPHNKILESHKSCDELPKVNVKNFISLYENASKSSLSTTPIHSSKTLNASSIATSKYEPMKAREVRSISPEMMHKKPSIAIPAGKRVTEKLIDHRLSPIYNIAGIDESELHTEIIDLSIESEHGERESPERDVFVEYKARFKLAKEYFQSKEELRPEPEKKVHKLNECEILLWKNSVNNERNTTPTKKAKKKVKSNTFPSSEIAYNWQEYDNKNKEGATKLVKISEKFNIDDLFNDVVGEGRLSRRGSFKGIPHKKAVLETFKSMENISDDKMSPYEMAISQLSEFGKEDCVKNAQTYLKEYPYLPQTAPNKYHSRLDPKAFGLISRQELLSSKPRRNSVPDLRLNATFTADL
ncbi:hypothetical protein EVAR_63886_1 [Eumeta japonica]|uniref:Uncharacterized protein n=1 Tax=Eumeta variegata TaxID=151549 RepID=A0A4C1ZB32_EUMVA|nr:hypothetical protein EVAR_63886_1 [Eumeta japonica]